jgi:hypothetical protein
MPPAWLLETIYFIFLVLEGLILFLVRFLSPIQEYMNSILRRPIGRHGLPATGPPGTKKGHAKPDFATAVHCLVSGGGGAEPHLINGASGRPPLFNMVGDACNRLKFWPQLQPVISRPKNSHKKFWLQRTLLQASLKRSLKPDFDLMYWSLSHINYKSVTFGGNQPKCC